MYKGLTCDCKACQGLSEQERAEKYERIMAARSKGGKIRAAQPSMGDARSRGFYATLEKHPEVIRWLGKRMKAQDRARAAEQGISYRKLRQDIKANATARYGAYIENLNREYNRESWTASLPYLPGSLWG